MYKVRVDWTDFVCDARNIDTFLSVLRNVKKVEGNKLVDFTVTIEPAPDYERLSLREEVKQEVSQALKDEVEQYKKWWLDGNKSLENIKKELSELKEKYSA